MALDEIGIFYIYPESTQEFTSTYLEEFILFSKIEDGENILIHGPEKSIGIFPILLSFMYPNSPITLIFTNSKVKDNFSQIVNQFSGIIDPKMIDAFLIEEIKEKEIVKQDKILSYASNYNEVELIEFISITKILLAKKSKLIYFEATTDFEPEYRSPAIMSNKQIENIFKQFRLKEVEDKSFGHELVGSYFLKAYVNKKAKN